MHPQKFIIQKMLMCEVKSYMCFGRNVDNKDGGTDRDIRIRIQNA